MRFSVALCTRDGARFLAGQLSSIAAQELPPLELIVSDDASSDGTAELAESFAQTAPFPVRLIRNAQPVGIVKNFEQAASACAGEAIAFSDQDDVWHPQKLTRLSAALQKADLAFSNARRIDAQGHLLPGSLWDHIGFKRSHRRSLQRGRPMEVLGQRNVVTGATMAIRRSLLAEALPFPDQGTMLHDEWLALTAAALGTIAAIDEPLIDYRQHSAQHSGAGERAGGLQRWVAEARRTGRVRYGQQAARLQLLLDRFGGRLPLERAREIRERIAHWQRRSTMPERLSARLPIVLSELLSLRYLRYSHHFWSAGKDLFW